MVVAVEIGLSCVEEVKKVKKQTPRLALVVEETTTRLPCTSKYCRLLVVVLMGVGTTLLVASY